MEGIGILRDVSVWYDKTELALDFHIFEVHDFNILIGHPIEKMFQNISPLGTLDVTLGGVRMLAYKSFGQKIPWPNLHPKKNQLTR